MESKRPSAFHAQENDAIQGWLSRQVTYAVEFLKKKGQRARTPDEEAALSAELDNRLRHLQGVSFPVEVDVAGIEKGIVDFGPFLILKPDALQATLGCCDKRLRKWRDSLGWRVCPLERLTPHEFRHGPSDFAQR
jgi:hypothetical protein